MKGSQREYARHRGVSHVAVGKAIKTGRIKLGKDGKINFADADAAWARNTDQIKQASTGGGEKTRKKERPAHASKPDKVEDPPPRAQESASAPPPIDGGGGVSLVKAQTMRAVYSAQREKLKFEEESGKKIDRDEVRVRAFTKSRIARDMLLSAPNRIAPLIVGMMDILQVTLILDEEMRRVAQEIAGIADVAAPV